MYNEDMSNIGMLNLSIEETERRLAETGLKEECGVFGIYDFDGNERVVDNHIKKLRKAIGGCGCSIQTVRKSGYRMEVGE